MTREPQTCPDTDLPLEAGRPRVQRLVDTLRPVHLEAEIPIRADWHLALDGLVARTVELSLPALAALGVRERAIDFHCVWGWSRPRCRWAGVSGADLLELCRPLPDAAYAVCTAAGSPYASCVTLDDFAAGIVAWELDGAALPPANGGPLRWIQPAHLWGYKGVKWLATVTFVDALQPGFWERLVGDVEGRVPDAVLGLFDQDADG